MHRSILSILTLATLYAFPATAHAESEGLRATAVVGLDRTDSAPGTGARDGVYYGAQLGYDVDLGGIALGVEAELGDSDARDPLIGGGAQQGIFADVALRLAVPLASDFRIFGRGGYAYHQVHYARQADFSGSGYTAGAGAEYDLSDRLLLRTEYRFSDYGRTVRGQRFLAGIGLRF